MHKTGTPHQYGNEIWGGIEFSHITGTVDAKESQRTYVDYDPVTGRAIRSALRQQVRSSSFSRNHHLCCSCALKN